jgi:hypothetical protein
MIEVQIKCCGHGYFDQATLLENVLTYLSDILKRCKKI